MTHLRHLISLSILLSFFTFSLTGMPTHHHKSNDCDFIRLVTGDEVMVKVLEVNEMVVKYLRCSNLTGTKIITKIENVQLIRYSNGVKLVITAINSSTTDDMKNGNSKRESALIAKQRLQKWNQ